MNDPIQVFLRHTYAVLLVLSVIAVGFPVAHERPVDAEVELEVAVDEGFVVAEEGELVTAAKVF